MYMHNTISALGCPQYMFPVTAKQLPVFAQWIQNIHSLAPVATPRACSTLEAGDQCHWVVKLPFFCLFH